MDIKQKTIKDFPFILSVTEASQQAVIDTKAFCIWLEQLQNLELLSESDYIDREEAYKELESGKALDLKDIYKK